MALRSGDRHQDAAFSEFVKTHSVVLFRLAFLMAGNRSDAEDLLQTALLRTYRHWDHAQEAPRPYARQVLLNLARDRGRASNRRPHEISVEVRSSTAVVSDHSAGTVAHMALVEAIRLLPVRQREVMALRFLEDLSVLETAQALGVSESTVTSTQSRALGVLRHILGDERTSDHV
jgi:RNA polymerase sigma-70 factor (sigma-E family)